MASLRRSEATAAERVRRGHYLEPCLPVGADGRRSSDLTSELQSSVRSDEVVIATEQFHVLIEPVVSNNTNELKTRAPGRFGLEVSRFGSPAVGRFLVYGRDSQPE